MHHRPSEQANKCKGTRQAAVKQAKSQNLIKSRTGSRKQTGTDQIKKKGRLKPQRPESHWICADEGMRCRWGDGRGSSGEENEVIVGQMGVEGKRLSLAHATKFANI